MMFLSNIALAFSFCLTAVSLAQSYAPATVPHNASCVPIVDLGYVKYVGYSNRTAGINYWRGIPYAQPPLGQLRWRKPRPIEARNNFTGQTIDATKIAPACIQNIPSFISPASVGAVLQQSEDCLILDVLTPIDPVTEFLPVMVQIHGGGYTLGYAESSPGDAMVNFSNGSMIYVQIQYRLGPFGFLGGSQVAENGARNAGLLDQRAALEWVQRNIRAFGGDPAKVTIWGGSAG